MIRQQMLLAKESITKELSEKKYLGDDFTWLNTQLIFKRNSEPQCLAILAIMFEKRGESDFADVLNNTKRITLDWSLLLRQSTHSDIVFLVAFFALRDALFSSEALHLKLDLRPNNIILNLNNDLLNMLFSHADCVIAASQVLQIHNLQIRPTHFLNFKSEEFKIFCDFFIKNDMQSLIFNVGDEAQKLHLSFWRNLGDFSSKVKLEKLDISNIPIANTGCLLPGVATAFKLMVPNLTSLGMDDCGINLHPIAWSEFSETFADNRLKNLSIANNRLNNIQPQLGENFPITKACIWLHRLSRLETLNLRNNYLYSITDCDWYLLQPVMIKLKKCDLTNNYLTSITRVETKVAFLTCVQEWQMDHLILHKQIFPDVAYMDDNINFQEFLEAVSASKIKSIEYSDCIISDENVKKLTYILKQNCMKSDTLKDKIIHFMYRENGKHGFFAKLNTLPTDLIEAIDEFKRPGYYVKK